MVGFAGYLGIWYGLLRSPSNSIILVPILAFGAVNGSIEYVSSLTIGLVLAACFATGKGRGSPAADAGEVARTGSG